MAPKFMGVIIVALAMATLLLVVRCAHCTLGCVEGHHMHACLPPPSSLTPRVSDPLGTSPLLHIRPSNASVKGAAL